MVELIRKNWHPLLEEVERWRKLLGGAYTAFLNSGRVRNYHMPGADNTPLTNTC